MAVQTSCNIVTLAVVADGILNCMEDSRKILIKGRGALSNPAGRYETQLSYLDDDGWDSLEHFEPTNQTQLHKDSSRSIIARNRSPDLPFEQSINPYRGCEHGCIYCYARPSHAYFGLSSGRDFEQQIFYKPEAATLLRKELSKPSYQCKTLALGTNTDPYQPVERKLKIMRGIVEVLHETRHPLSITTKGSLIERDLDLLEDMAKRQLVVVAVSVTTLDAKLSQKLDPRASAPHRRLQTIGRLAERGVPVHLSLAPLIPSINDMELEEILQSGAVAGATTASWILIRLPYEVKDLFREWLNEHYPDRAGKIMNCIREARGGQDNDPRFHQRFRAKGVYMDVIRKRFALACEKLELNRKRNTLNTGLFIKPAADSEQMSLF